MYKLKNIETIYTVEVDDFGGSWWSHSIKCKTLKDAEKIVANVQSMFGLAREAKIVITYK